MQWNAFKTGRVWYALITLLYVDILDTTGTLYSMAKFAGLRDPITLDFENSTLAYCVDAFSISMGALMGTSPVTAFVESATGIAEGGRTGLTAITISLCFLLSVFFAPIFASIPAWATGSALIIVGSLMIRNVKEINWEYPGDAIPAFLTLILIPLTYNIAYGVIAGVGSYVLLNGGVGVVRWGSKGRVRPTLYELGERWSVPPGGLVPGWMRRGVRGVRSGRKGWWRVWEDAEADEQGVLRGVGVQSSVQSSGGQGSVATAEYGGQYGGRYGAGESLYGPRSPGSGHGSGPRSPEMGIDSVEKQRRGRGMQGVVLGHQNGMGMGMGMPRFENGMGMEGEDDSGSEKDLGLGVSVSGYPPRKFA